MTTRVPNNSGSPKRLDQESFAAAYRDAYPALLLVASAESARDEADDVVQKAAIIAIERLDKFEPGTNFRAWMSAIVRGVARNHRRGRKRMTERHRKLAVTETLEKNPHEFADETADAPRVHLAQSSVRVDFPDRFHAELRNAVGRLGPVQGACLVLRAVHGFSYDEISEMLDIPAATARSHVFRARGALASMLESGRGTDG